MRGVRLKGLGDCGQTTWRVVPPSSTRPRLLSSHVVPPFALPVFLHIIHISLNRFTCCDRTGSQMIMSDTGILRSVGSGRIGRQRLGRQRILLARAVPFGSETREDL